MSIAQDKAKANFKKAIAYRSKTGCSLKEAFAHIKGKKTIIKKKATVKKVGAIKKKTTPKKVAKKKAPKKLKYAGTAKAQDGKKMYKYSLGKKPTEKDVLKSIQKSEKMQKSHMFGIDNKQKAMNTLMLMEKDLFDAIKFREDYKNTPIVKGSNNYYEFKNITQKRYFINKKNSEIKARKKAISEQYKLLKSIN